MLVELEIRNQKVEIKWNHWAASVVTQSDWAKGCVSQHLCVIQSLDSESSMRPMVCYYQSTVGNAYRLHEWEDFWKREREKDWQLLAEQFDCKLQKVAGLSADFNRRENRRYEIRNHL